MLNMNWLDVGRLPLPLLRATARATAWLINQQPQRGMLHKARVNLQLAYPHLPPADRERCARQSVVHQCLSYAETLKCWAMPPQWSIEQIAQVIGMQYLHTALADPRGVLMIVPHLGTWEIMNAWLNQFGQPTIMYKPVRNPQLNQLMLSARQRLQATLVATDAGGVKAMFRNLKQGGFSIILPDHVPPLSGGVIVPFFGVPCLTGTLTAKMLQKTHCATLGLSCIRRQDGRFDLYITPLDDPELYAADVTVATAALNRALEKIIAPQSSHYHWGYKRFKGVAAIEQHYQITS